MKKRCLSILLALCIVMGMVPSLGSPAAAASNGAMVLPKGSGSGQGFIYYNFVETTQFVSGTTYAFLDAEYGPEDAVAQLGSGAVLEATEERNNCTFYMTLTYGPGDYVHLASYVNVVVPGKGFDTCPKGGLHQVTGTSNPTEYRYFCWAGGARNCGPLYAYTYETATITWDNVTVYLNDPGSTGSNSSDDYTVELTYGGGNTVTLDSRSYTVSVSGRTATVTITDNDGNTIQGTVTLPCGVVYQPGGLNVTNMPANQGILPEDGSVSAAAAPSRAGYEFQGWSDGQLTFAAGDSIPYKADGEYTLTALWKDTQPPQFTCGTVEVTAGASGEMVRNSIQAALKITDNEPVSECTVTVAADDDTAKTRGDKQVTVTITDKAGNATTRTVSLTVLPGPLAFDEPVYENSILSATLLEPGADTITETGIVWSVMSYPTTTVNNGKFTTSTPVTTPGNSISTSVELAQGVPYYVRAYAKVDGITYYGPQATIGDSIPEYGVFTITNSGGSTFTVHRTDGSDGVQTVYFRTVNGSAVGGTHFAHQSGTLTFADGETSKTITITEHGVNAAYNGNTATGYSNDSRTYSVEIYRVDGGAVIENNRASAKRTMTGNTTVDRNEFEEKTQNGDTNETTRGDYNEDGQLGWTNGLQGSQQDHIFVQPTDTAIRSYLQAVSQEIRFYVTFDACEQDSGYQAVQIVPGDKTDTSIYPYDKNGGKLQGSYSDSTTIGYTALFEHGGSSKNTSYLSYRFPAQTPFTSGSTLTAEQWQGTDTGDYVAFPVNTDQVTVSYGACGDNNDKWKTKNVVYHYRFIDTKEPTLLAVADMGSSTYRVGDSFTVSLIFDEIVDSQNSGNLSGSTISTSWGEATYAGGGNTNVLYFTGTVPATATDTLTVTGTTATIKDMAGNAATSVSGSTTASVDTRTPSFELSNGSISGDVGQATISGANENTTSLRYAWSQSSSMPAAGWIPLTAAELEAAKTSGFQVITRQESGVWYLHVLGVCDSSGALAYKSTSVNFGSGGSSGDPDPIQRPTISVSVDNTNWATSRTINVTYTNGTAQYRYGAGSWQTITGNSVTVTQNGTYAFRCVSSSNEAVTASATVEKIDTTAPTAAIGAMTANTPTQKEGVYHSVTLPVSYLDTQSGVQTVEYLWSNSAAVPNSGWTPAGDATQLTYTAVEDSETGIYLHLRVTDKVGNSVTVSSPACQVISEQGAKNYAPTITIGLATNSGDGFTSWDGSTWTNETQTLVWKLEGVKDSNYVVTLPDGRTTSDTSGTILVSQNGTYTVSVVDNTYGGSNSASHTIDKIDTTAPTAAHDWTETGWQSSAVTVTFTFVDQGGSGLKTAKYAVVTDDTVTPASLTDFASINGGNVTVSQDGAWYIYYEVTDGTAGTYGDGTARAANTTSGFVGPIQINTTAPGLDISGGDTGAASLELNVTSDGSVTVSKNGGQAEPVSGTYNVTETGTYTFTATSNAGLTTQKTVQVYSITFDSDGSSAVDRQLVVKDGTATEPTAPQKNGYTFEGWMNNQTAWDFENIVTKDLTLTAKWTLDVPAVTLTASKNDVTYGEEIILTANASHTGGDDVNLTYTWYKDNSMLPGEAGDTLTLKDVAHSGTYTVKVTATGDGQTQEATSDAVEVAIAPRTVVLSWNYVDPITYNGQAHTITASVTNLVQGDTCSLTYTGTSEATNVGDYEVMVNGLSSSNYTLEGATGTVLNWKIVQAAGSATVTMEDWTYGDTAKAPVPVSSTHGTANVTYHYTGTTTGGEAYDSDAVPTDAGNYTVTAIFAATQNYEAITGTDTFTIAPRPAELHWNYIAPIPYDGQQHTVTPSVSNLVEDDTCELTCEDHQKTDAGTYTAKVTALSNPNYTLEGGVNTTLEWQITPIAGTAAVTMEGWTYDGTAKNSPVPTSDTNGTDHVTYRYIGTTAGSEAYDSDAIPTDAGYYTVTATFAATQNYQEVTAQAEFTIAKKSITATWTGLDWVYGETIAVDVMLPGIVDDVTADIQGIGEKADSYPLTAVLTGEGADNYTLNNDQATLTIQPKPVIFTVSDNVCQADGNTKEATVTPNDDDFTAYSVTYLQNDKEVSAPKEAGSYEIWVNIDNSNYRHTDGSDEMQVGTLTIVQAQPVLYTVSFDGGEDVTGTMAELEAVGGSVLTLPECAYDRTDYKFNGWRYADKLYQPGDCFTVPSQDVTFTAQWQAVFEVSVTIEEETDDGVQPAEGAVLSLWLGANKIDETTAQTDGTYTFEGLIPGIYNLVVTKDVRTVTSKVEIKDKDTVCNATLPKGATNSIVEVTPGSPDIVVGKLDTVFDQTDDAVYTSDDAQNVEKGGKVEITFTAAVKQKTDVASDLEKIQTISGGSNLALTMDYTLTKTVTTPDGSKGEPQSITQSNVPLEVLLPLPTELQGKDSYFIYRVHDGEAQELKQGEANKNEWDEYFVVNSDKTGLTLYVRCFSTYAVGYTEFTGSSGGGGGGSSTIVYPPKVEETERGTVTVKPSSPQKGDKVIVIPTPEEGYTVDEVTVTDAGGKPVEVTPNDDGTYTFTQPSGKVTITVTFRPVTDTSDCPRDENCPMAPFTDADRNAWYHDGVHYCVENGLMVGISQTAFAPDTAITRGMLVTILWRLEGSPIVDAPMAYDDVDPESWYAEAVRWGDSTGVVTGYGNGKFGPSDPITREQMATMLWRYVGSPEVDGGLSSFADGQQTSSWAQPAMIWAAEQGLITGVGNGRLEPGGQATRAQAATILMRYIKNMEK